MNDKEIYDMYFSDKENNVCDNELADEQINEFYLKSRKENTNYSKLLQRAILTISLTGILIQNINITIAVFIVVFIVAIVSLRALKEQSKYLKYVYILTFIRCLIFLISLSMIATVYGEINIFKTPLTYMVIANYILLFISIFYIRAEFISLKARFGMKQNSIEIVAFIICLLAMIFLALSGYKEVFLYIVLSIIYTFIVYKIVSMAKIIGNNITDMKKANNVISDKFLISILVVFSIGTIFAFNMFFSSYPMKWTYMGMNDNNDMLSMKNELVSKGFPKSIVDDLTDIDVLRLDGAKRIITSEDIVKNNNNSSNSEMKITCVALRYDDMDGCLWKVLNHFEWLDKPDFYGTEAFMIQPTYYQSRDWDNIGEKFGALLYEKNGSTYASPFYSILREDESISGEYISINDMLKEKRFIANFSFPNDGEKYRGYVIYSTEKLNKKKTNIYNKVDYVHQNTRLIFPARTAFKNIKDIMLRGNNYYKNFVDVNSIFKFSDIY